LIKVWLTRRSKLFKRLPIVLKYVLRERGTTEVLMIEYKSGNLLDSGAEALVNTINTVGVMGKGIALQFKQAFPDNFKAYEAACRHNQVRLGKMFVYHTHTLHSPRLIINFPTKRQWKGKSIIQDIADGLSDLVQVIRSDNVHSIAIPPWGCGSGGLNWREVKPLIEAYLGDSTYRPWCMPHKVRPKQRV